MKNILLILLNFNTSNVTIQLAVDGEPLQSTRNFNTSNVTIQPGIAGTVV